MNHNRAPEWQKVQVWLKHQMAIMLNGATKWTPLEDIVSDRVYNQHAVSQKGVDEPVIAVRVWCTNTVRNEIDFYFCINNVLLPPRHCVRKNHLEERLLD